MLAPTSFLNSTGLDIKYDRYAFEIAIFFLNNRKIFSRVPFNFLWKVRTNGLFFLVENDRDILHTHRKDLACYSVCRQPAINALPSSQGNRIVVKDFISNIDVRRQSRAYGENAGMVIRAIAHVLEYVLGV